MKIDGLNLDVFVVVKRRGKLKLRRGRQVFDSVYLGAFGFNPDSPQVPIIIYRKERGGFRYHDTTFAVYAGCHPAGTLLAIEREFTEQGVTERIRVIPKRDDGAHARIWSVVEDES